GHQSAHGVCCFLCVLCTTLTTLRVVLCCVGFGKVESFALASIAQALSWRNEGYWCIADKFIRTHDVEGARPGALRSVVGGNAIFESFSESERFEHGFAVCG